VRSMPSIMALTFQALFMLLLSACTPPGVIIGLISQPQSFTFQDTITFKDPVKNFDKMSADAITPSGFRVSSRTGAEIQYNRASGFFEQMLIGKIENFSISTSLLNDQRTVIMVAVVIGNLGTAEEGAVRKVIDQIKDRFASMAAIVPKGAETVVTRVEDRRPCAANFSKTGSMSVGQKFTTFEVFPKVQRAAVYDKIFAAIAKSGYRIASNDREAGVISAFQGAGAGSSRTIPLNAVVTANAPAGARADLLFQTPDGILVHDADVVKEFCQILGSVSG
jgi:hypothetical protein